MTEQQIRRQQRREINQLYDRWIDHPTMTTDQRDSEARRIDAWASEQIFWLRWSESRRQAA